MKQIWKDVRDFEGLYQVSNLGRVKSLNYNHTGKEKIRKLVKNKDGYLQVKLCKKGQKPSNPLVHVLVFQAFYRRLLPNEDCHHLNQVRDCNISTNLVAKDESIHVGQHLKGVKKSEQHKQKLSEAKKGKKRSEQSKAKAKATKIKNGTWCKKHSQQEKKKMSEVRKGIIFSQQWKKHIGEASKKIKRLKDPITGKFLKKENNNEN